MEISTLYKIYKSNPKICTDTRKIEKGEMFFALKGENFNGNKFATKAISDGCSFAIIDEKQYCTSNKCILVENVLETLQNLAKHHRQQLSIPIVGITGSNGKTTSKELIYSVLNSEINCYATKGNLNNHIGVPLSILEITNEYEIAIIEMGANHEGEIKFLCDIAKPTHGVITNIGIAHLEGFKSPTGVINAKNELYQYIDKNKGTAFVNSDDQLLLDLSESITRITYGNNGFFQGTTTTNTPYLSIKFNTTEMNSKLIGEYQFSNIMLAICIGKNFNVKNANIKHAIENYTPKNNRSEIFQTNDNMLILDAYNANPSSMKAMITSFSRQDYDNKLCILGDMLELGKYTIDEHAAILNLVETLNLEVFLIGKEFSKICKKAFKDRNEFELFLKSNPIKNKTILLKGSRGISLEKLTKYL
ncbi:MAG: UDP-N-acetylmuramoyl-tripeptide--D-alanyl-D-alanine ligase [Bacteroidota bacterium]|nr:UDP-N-acetylmuramoyl-tripeptide--D-alanyl-D-alanine ligase [Bacteroidota bacterium]